jgi:hypothetical protein
MLFWIDIEFTKTLGQFKQKKNRIFIHDIQFQVFFLPFKFYSKKKCLIVKILLFKGQGENEVLLTWLKSKSRDKLNLSMI